MAKKNKEKIMKFKVIVEKDEYGYYVADVPELQEKRNLITMLMGQYMMIL